MYLAKTFFRLCATILFLAIALFFVNLKHLIEGTKSTLFVILIYYLYLAEPLLVAVILSKFFLRFNHLAITSGIQK